MSIRKTLLATAVGTVLSTAAFAGVPTQVSTDNQVLFMSGATATDTTLESVWRLATNPGGVGINCAAGTVGVFRAGASEAAVGVHRTIICQGTGNLAPGQGTIPAAGANQIAITKESNGGSGNAFGPVNGTQNIAFHDVRNMTCAGADGNIATAPANDGNFGGAGGNVPNTTAIPAAAGLLAANAYYNCAPGAARRSNAGISDVEAALFDTVGQNETSLQQVMFGVPVSLNLYRALQVAQGLSTGACSTLAAQDTQACAPTLSSSVIRALYTGVAVTDWTALSDGINIGTPGTGTDLTSVAGVTAPANNNVYICRRGNTSGTQRYTRAHFLGEGCGGADTFATATNATCNNPSAENDGCGFTNGDTTIVFANSSSGNVMNCLDERDDQNVWAIGVLSVESTVNDIGGTGGDARDALGVGGAELHTREYRWVRVDGALPSLESAAAGAYEFYSENVCTRANDVAATSDKGRIHARVCGSQGLANPTILAGIADTLDGMPHGGGGLMAKPDYVTATPNPAPVTLAAMVANPVNITTKSLTGGVNNCSAAVALPIPGVATQPAGTGQLP